MNPTVDLTPYIPVFTGLITLLAALGAVWIKSAYDRRAAHEQRQFDLNHADKQQGLEASRAAAEEQKEAEKVAQRLSGEIADKFLELLSVVRKYDATDQEFRAWYKESWGALIDIPLRALVGQVRDDTSRAEFLTLLDALQALDQIIRYNRIRTHQSICEHLLVLGFDLASTRRRGQELDDGVLRLLSLNEHRIAVVSDNREDSWPSPRETTTHQRGIVWDSQDD